MKWAKERLIRVEVEPIRDKEHKKELKEKYKLGKIINKIFFAEVVRYE